MLRRTGYGLTWKAAGDRLVCDRREDGPMTTLETTRRISLEQRPERTGISD